MARTMVSGDCYNRDLLCFYTEVTSSEHGQTSETSRGRFDDRECSAKVIYRSSDQKSDSGNDEDMACSGRVRIVLISPQEPYLLLCAALRC